MAEVSDRWFGGEGWPSPWESWQVETTDAREVAAELNARGAEVWRLRRDLDDVLGRVDPEVAELWREAVGG